MVLATVILGTGYTHVIISTGLWFWGYLWYNMHMYVYIYISVHMYMHIYIYIYICICVYIYTYIWILFIRIYVYLCIYLSIYPSNYLSIYLPTYTNICMYILYIGNTLAKIQKPCLVILEKRSEGSKKTALSLSSGWFGRFVAIPDLFPKNEQIWLSQEARLRGEWIKWTDVFFLLFLVSKIILNSFFSHRIGIPKFFRGLELHYKCFWGIDFLVLFLVNHWIYRNQFNSWRNIQPIWLKKTMVSNKNRDKTERWCPQDSQVGANNSNN